MKVAPIDEAEAELQSLRVRLAHVEAERSEADHRIAHSLRIAASFLSTERSRVADDAARDALAAVEMRLRGIARLHRRVNGDDVADRVAMRGFLHDLAADMTAALGLACVVGCDDFSVPHAIAIELAVALSELGLNAARHAQHEHGDARIVVDCRRLGAGFRLTVSDHGPGLPEGFDVDGPGGLGIPAIDAAVRRLGGTLSAHTKGGAVFTLAVPLS